MSETVVPYSIDSIFRSVGVGSLDRAMADNLYGINHMQNVGMLKSNRDQQGYVFVTRPQLNLQADNIRNYPELYPLLNEDPRSLAKAVRMVLDPRLGVGYNFRKQNASASIPPIYSTLIDNNCAFIPMITNLTKSLTGWPDEVMATKASDPGLLKQSFVVGDGTPKNYENTDLSFNVMNTAGDAVALLLHVWLHYIGAIKMKWMTPYIDSIINDRVDYFCRTYRVVLNERKTHVTKIFANIYGFPTSSPTGMFADFNMDTPFSEQTKEISFRMKSVGFIAYDPRLIRSFNRTVQMFNFSMTDKYREDHMRLIPMGRLREFNHRAYPRINEYTKAMEWWVPRDNFDRSADGETSVGEEYEV